MKVQGVAAGGEDEYFKGARSWEHDRVREALRSRTLAWWAAGAAAVVATVALGAVAALAPLKTVVPYVIKVDRSTGQTEIVTALKGPGPRTYEDAVSRYFLAQYVRYREGWLPQAARENAYSVTVMSVPSEQQRYMGVMSASNKTSPQVVIGDGGFVSVGIRSISFLSPTVAQVRFTKVSTVGQSGSTAANWVATISFQYSSAPELERDRMIDPLGFQVVNYRADPEV